MPSSSCGSSMGSAEIDTLLAGLKTGATTRAAIAVTLSAIGAFHWVRAQVSILLVVLPASLTLIIILQPILPFTPLGGVALRRGPARTNLAGPLLLEVTRGVQPLHSVRYAAGFRCVSMTRTTLTERRLAGLLVTLKERWVRVPAVTPTIQTLPSA